MGFCARSTMVFFVKGQAQSSSKSSETCRQAPVCIWNTVTVGFCESTRYTQKHTPTGLFLSRQWSTSRVDKAKRGVAFSYTRRK